MPESGGRTYRSGIPALLLVAVGSLALGCIERRGALSADTAERTGPELVKVCATDQECGGYPDGTCAPVLMNTGNLRMMCWAPAGSDRGGVRCSSHQECRSGVCLRTGADAFCFEACEEDGDCASDTWCRQVEFGVGEGHSLPVDSCVPQYKRCHCDADCWDESVCLPVHRVDEPEEVAMVCMPAQADLMDGGKTCQDDEGCRSGLCLELPYLQDRYCYSACDEDKDCPPGLQCSAGSLPLSLAETTDTPPAGNVQALGSCTPPLGTFTNCQSDGHCSEGETCSLYSNVDATELQPMCFPVGASGYLKAGAHCQQDSECRSGHCLLLPYEARCFGLCWASTDCTDGTTCHPVAGYVVNDLGDEFAGNDLVEPIQICLP